MSQIQVSDFLKGCGNYEKIIPIRLSCITKNDWPLVLSLWYTIKDGKIYCATQKDAKIVKHLQNNPRCAFEISADSPPYYGWRGRGTVKLKKENADEILLILIKKYLKDPDSSLAKLLLKKRSNEISIEITPEKIYSWDYSKRMS